MFCRLFQHGLCAGLVLACVMAPSSGIGETPIAEQHHRITRWTTEDGLPQNTVTSLAQTPDGYLWAGTRRGLARFDGVRFTVFARELQVNEQSDLSCQELKVDGAGRLWIRFEDRIVSYHQGTFERFPCPPSGPGAIQTAIASRNGGLWLGTLGEGLKRFEHGRFTRTISQVDGLETDWVALLSEDRQGRVWIASTEHGLPPFREWRRFDPASGELVTLSNVLGQTIANPRDILPGSDDRLWLKLPTELACWHKGKLSRYAATGPGDFGDLGRPVEDARGALWFAPGNGTSVIRFHAGRFESFEVEPPGGDRDLRCIVPDREGNVWVGTGARGLVRVQPQRVTSLFTTSASGGKQEIYSVAASARGAVWLAAGGSLLRWQNGAVDRITKSNAVNVDLFARLFAVFEDRRGQVWCSGNNGLLKYEHGIVARVASADAGRSNWVVTGFHEDRAGRLWIGSTDGLLERRDDRFILHTTRDGLSENHIRGICDAPDGSVWAGTRSGGLNQFQDGRFRIYTTHDGLLANKVRPLLVEDDGTLWAATDRGLNRIRSNEIRSITPRQGLPEAPILSLPDDGRGNYWSHGTHGLYRMLKADLHAVADGSAESLFCASYGEGDGMASAEGNGDCQPSAARTADGRLWFATTRGVAVLDPGALVEAELPPTALIEEVFANDELAFANGVATSDRWTAGAMNDGIRFPPGGANLVEIHFTSTVLSAPAKVRFKFRLHGADQEWRDAGARRAAYYTRLRPGHYQFEVKAMDHRGSWSPTPAVLGFSVAPYFWQTRSCYVLAGLGVIAAIAGVQAWRLRWQRRLLKAEHERALASERTRIARDLHDDLGTALTGLALEMDVASRDASALPETARKLNGTAQNARALADRMREVVWAVNPRCDNVPSLAGFLEEQTGKLMRSAGLDYRLELPEDVPDLPLDSETRHEIVLCVREACTNVIRHAQARRVSVRLAFARDGLTLIIADDGKGIEAAPGNGARNGLANLRSRMQRIGGTVSCQRGASGGTVLTFEVPLGARPSTPPKE